MRLCYLPLFSVLILLFITSPCTGVRAQCDDPQAVIDLEGNAVRTRLTTNGSLWNGGYTVTADEGSPNANPASAISAGAFWIAGQDPGGGLFVRAPLYGTGQGNYGYQPGPLINGQTGPDTCARWNRFFVVTEEELRVHQNNYRAAIDSGALPLPPDQIPAAILGWPGSGNPHFEARNGFPLHDTPNGLAPFWDENFDGSYDPAYGDYPLFCGKQGIWSVFNTLNTGGENETGSNPMQIDVMASAPGNAAPDLQRTTFYTYTVRNYAPEDIYNTYVGHFINSDLGCTDNDRTGSMPDQGLFYAYNDEPTEGDCPGGEAGYGRSTPVNVFQVVEARLPYLSFDDEIHGINRHITFYNDGNTDSFPAGTQEPTTPQEAYNIIQGRWRDGNFQLRGGNGYDQATGEATSFSFDGLDANDSIPWHSPTAGVPATDVSSVYSMGPFTLEPGTTFTFTLAVTTLFDVDYTAENGPDRAVIQERARAIRRFYENDRCPSDPVTISAAEPATTIALEVFPNPASNLLTFRLPENEQAERLELLDLNGRVVVSTAMGNSSYVLNIAEYGMAPGSYFYRLFIDSERLVTGKIILRGLY